jgi:hypothetical protein
MLRRSVLGTAVATVAVLVTVLAAITPASAAVRPFAPPQTVAGACNAETADTATAASGAVVGFATCQTPTDQAIRFFSRTAAGTVNPSEPTPFRGRVLGVANDVSATFVMYADATQIRVGKRTSSGQFSSRLIAGWSGGGTLPTGDVIARNGQWFGVWSVPFGPGGEFAQTELFFAASGRAAQRLTTTAGNIDDSEPTLAYAGTIPVLIWTEAIAPAVPGQSNLIVSRFRGNGQWEPRRVFASNGFANGSPDMTIAGPFTYVTWTRDGGTMVASNATGAFTSHRFLTPARAPKVGVATAAGTADHVFVTATASRAGGDEVWFAESATTGNVGGTWSGAFIAPAGTRAFGVGAFATKATVVYGNATSMVARAQA